MRSFFAIKHRMGTRAAVTYYLEQTVLSAAASLGHNYALSGITHWLGQLQSFYPLLQETSLSRRSTPGICDWTEGLGLTRSAVCPSSGPHAEDAWDEVVGVFWSLMPYVGAILTLYAIKAVAQSQLEESMAASLRYHSALGLPNPVVYYTRATKLEHPKPEVKRADVLQEPEHLENMLRSSTSLVDEMARTITEACYGGSQLLHYASPLRIPGTPYCVPDMVVFVAAYCVITAAALEGLSSYYGEKERISREALERMQELRQSVLTNLKSVVASDSEWRMERKMVAADAKQSQAFQSHSLSRTMLQTAQSTTRIFLYCLVPFFAAWKLLEGRLTVAQVYDFRHQIQNIVDFFGFSGKNAATIQNCAIYSGLVTAWDEKYRTALATLPPKVVHQADLGPQELLVLQRGFSMVHPDGTLLTTASKDIVLHAGSFVQLEGANGAGKSSFFLALLNKPHPAHGRGKVLRARGSVVLAMPQEPYEPSVGPISLLHIVLGVDHGAEVSNIALSQAEKDRLLELWTDFRLKQDYYDKLQECRDRPLERMSGGEKQKIFLLGSIFRYERMSSDEKKRPRIVLLDEVWSAMDPDIVPILRSKCREIFADALVLVIEHQKSPDPLYTHALRLEPSGLSYEALRPSAFLQAGGQGKTKKAYGQSKHGSFR